MSTTTSERQPSFDRRYDFAVLVAITLMLAWLAWGSRILFFPDHFVA